MHGSQDGCSGFRHHNCAYGKNKEKAVRSPLVFPFYWESKAFLGTFLVDFLLCLVARTVGAFKPYQQERWGKAVFSFPDSTEKTGKRDGRGQVPLCDPVTVYAWITTGRVFKCFRFKQICATLFILEIRSQKSEKSSSTFSWICS